MSRCLALIVCLVLPLIQAAVVDRSSGYDHAPVARSAWYQSDDHPAHRLFKRQSFPTDGVTYPTVGSPAWTSAYPPGAANTSQLPQEWVNALNAAVAAGNIPNLTVSKNNPQELPTYGGLNPNGPQVCSSTYGCRISGDIWDAPAGSLACGFDDGPLPPSPALYDFLQKNNQHATHFFIGTNILQYPSIFTQAFTNGDDIAVHTWTHPFMTTLTNLELIGEFGWTMEIIHNSTGGRLPRFWRPPYGDSDVRVHAIAKEVFGLTAILWNQDSSDWMLPSGTSEAQVSASLTKWITGPKNPGLIILEHELSTQSVQAFMTAYPLMKSNGWNITSTAQLAGNLPYQNSDSSTSPVTPASGVILGDISSKAPSPTTATSSIGGSGTAKPSSGGSSANKNGSGVTLRAGMGVMSLMLSGVAGAVILTVVPMFA